MEIDIMEKEIKRQLTQEEYLQLPFSSQIPAFS